MGEGHLPNALAQKLTQLPTRGMSGSVPCRGEKTRRSSSCGQQRCRGVDVTVGAGHIISRRKHGENQEWCDHKEDGKLNPILVMTSERNGRLEFEKATLQYLVFNIIYGIIS